MVVVVNINWNVLTCGQMHVAQQVEVWELDMKSILEMLDITKLSLIMCCIYCNIIMSMGNIWKSWKNSIFMKPKNANKFWTNSVCQWIKCTVRFSYRIL
jgi:hypothetical protein